MTEGVRRALDAVEVGRPGGLVVPEAVLAGRVADIHARNRACRFAEVATDLPGLIRDLHTALDAEISRDLLALVVRLHVHVTRMWLIAAGAPADLRRRAVFVARNAAREHTAAPLEAAADMAARFGEYPGDPLGFAFGPTNVAFRRVHMALEVGDPEAAVAIFEAVNPEANPFPASRAYHWVGYGRALAHLPERHADVAGLRAAGGGRPGTVVAVGVPRP